MSKGDSRYEVRSRFFLVDKWVASKPAVPMALAPAKGPMQTDLVNEKSVAVLPFVDKSDKHDNIFKMQDEIAVGLIAIGVFLRSAFATQLCSMFAFRPRVAAGRSG